MQFIPVIATLSFQQSLLQSSVSHDPSEIIIICLYVAQETFINIISNTLCIMYYKSSFNALIMLCNVPNNGLYNLMNNFNHSLYIITLIINSLLHYAF